MRRLRQRVDALEGDQLATVLRLTAAVVAVLVREPTILERRAFRRVAVRVGELWKAMDGPAIGFEIEPSPESSP